MTATTVVDDVPEKPIPEEVRRLRAATSSPVAEEIVMALLSDLKEALSDLQEAREELSDLQGIQAEADRLEARLEDLRGQQTPMARFEEVMAAAHSHARHVGTWDVCPHPICREVEDQLLAIRKGLA